MKNRRNECEWVSWGGSGKKEIQGPSILREEGAQRDKRRRDTERRSQSRALPVEMGVKIVKEVCLVPQEAASFKEVPPLKRTHWHSTIVARCFTVSFWCYALCCAFFACLLSFFPQFSSLSFLHCSFALCFLPCTFATFLSYSSPAALLSVFLPCSFAFCFLALQLCTFALCFLPRSFALSFLPLTFATCLSYSSFAPLLSVSCPAPSQLFFLILAPQLCSLFLALQLRSLFLTRSFLMAAFALYFLPCSSVAILLSLSSAPQLSYSLPRSSLVAAFLFSSCLAAFSNIRLSCLQAPAS
jgi:hypothetical protein